MMREERESKRKCVCARERERERERETLQPETHSPWGVALCKATWQEEPAKKEEKSTFHLQ